ncbi:DUF2156 domain-containing protein [Lachnospiraceae bacterium LCP25S3_G4]
MKEIEFKRPMMEDKELLESYFKKYPSRSCERTFVNVFLWSRAYGVEYAVIENAIVFRQKTEKGCAFAYPVGAPEDVKRAIERLQNCCEYGNSLRLYHVTEEGFAQLEAWYPGVYQIEYDRDIADYVYEAEKLATLSGKKLHGKRNHINKFKATYENWAYESLSKDNVEECFQMALKWRSDNGCDDDVEKNKEMCVTLNSLRLFEELGLKGGILRVDGEIVAFTMGEPICDDTFVVHIEKAFPDIPGAYPMINQQFVEHECMDYKYINREEDTGAEGLRKAKLSYRPAFLVEKGIVTKKQ